MIAKSIAALLALALVGLSLWQSAWDMAWLEDWIYLNPVLGGGVYVFFLILSVVFLPFSSLPLLPLATRIFGVVPTAMLSAMGWWIGCLIAFQIERFGRPLLERVTSLEAIDRLESKVPQDVGFGGIVVLRIILPVDVVSFSLGLLKSLRLRTYATASLLGIVPFAFVWSFAGGQLGRGQFLSFTLVMVGLTAVVLTLRRLWKKARLTHPTQ